MPIYDYQCQDCEHTFEVLQKISDGAPASCPECSKGNIVKKVSASGFRLKGDGWYETDFKTGSKKNLADSGSAPKSGDAS